MGMLYRIRLWLCLALPFCGVWVMAQPSTWVWTRDGLGYYELVDQTLLKVDPRKEQPTVVLTAQQLTPSGQGKPLNPEQFFFSSDYSQILFFVNTARVWRYHTRGEYWVYDLTRKQLRALGKGLPARSLMFAKFSPDGKQVAYVSEHNLFAEELATGKVRKLTTDGTRKLINGTFDWVYEEEFGCRDGFRWSPDSRQIAYWQVDATRIRDYLMLNATDSAYSRVIPVEYPKAGEAPSAVRIGVVALANSVTRWMKIEGDPRQHYLTRMEWSESQELVVQQLDRRQQESRLIYCNTQDGSARTFWAEYDKAWVDLNTDRPEGWLWVNGRKDFLWVSEKDGWRHIYRISRDGKNAVLLTKGEFDVGRILGVDETNNYVYFSASPDNPTQLYLYRVRINPLGKNGSAEAAEAVGTSPLKGTHEYLIGPQARIARHSFSNYQTPDVLEWISLPDHRPLRNDAAIGKQPKTDDPIRLEYVKLQTVDDITLDAWIRKPTRFSAAKKYPLVIYLYGEPAATTTDDRYGNHDNFLYNGSMSDDGYIQMALDNRGTPSLRGAAWRKAIYRRNGQVNIRDMAMGIRKALELPYVDKSRVAIWGWSGGGTSTLHLLFQFPDLAQTGIAIAPITDMLLYDNIYTERYMGLPQENKADYVKGSVLTHAAGLKGNLLLIHGSGDDNVHFGNSERLVNELVKYNKTFEFMDYPNRSHSLSEGEGTRQHLSALYTRFLKQHCPPGPK